MAKSYTGRGARWEPGPGDGQERRGNMAIHKLTSRKGICLTCGRVVYLRNFLGYGPPKWTHNRGDRQYHDMREQFKKIKREEP